MDEEHDNENTEDDQAEPLQGNGGTVCRVSAEIMDNIAHKMNHCQWMQELSASVVVK